jgi:hypothetical protein
MHLGRQRTAGTCHRFGVDAVSRPLLPDVESVYLGVAHRIIRNSRRAGVLGFLKAEEMRDIGAPFERQADWEREVKAHNKPLFPERVWDQPIATDGALLLPVIRSIEVSIA